MMKSRSLLRLCAMVLVCALAVGCLPSAWAVSGFTDVPENAYYTPAVQWAVSKTPQITNGTSATTFSPDRICTRGQIVTFLWRAAGCPTPKTGASPFTDVSRSAYYYQAVLWAVEKGITNGVTANRFGPDNACTRGQVVTFLYRAAGSPGHSVSDNPFGDITPRDYYYNPVLWAASNGITNGITPNRFGPNQGCTRGQVVTFLYRVELKNNAAQDLAGTYSITIWSTGEVIPLTRQQITNFNAANTYGIRINASFKECTFSNMGTTVLGTYAGARPDLFLFPQDQFSMLLHGGALSQIPEAVAKEVSSANVDSVLSAAAKDGNLYAYPMTADNGYFLYYDKTVVKNPASLDAIVSDCRAAGKKVAMELSSGWYSAAFFFGAGCVSRWTVSPDGKFTAVEDTYNSAAGINAAQAMQRLISSGAFVNSSSVAQFSSGAGAVVSGTWDYDQAVSILGSRLGVAAMPYFNAGGTSRHMGSFSGCKLLGIKPQADAKRQAALHELARYLTGERCQVERYQQVSWVPSNTAAQSLPQIQSYPALKALVDQSPYAVPQGQIPEDWWGVTSVLYNDIKAAGTTAAIRTALSNYDRGVKALVQ